MTNRRVFALTFALLLSSPAMADRGPASFVSKKFSVQLQDTDIRDALRIIAQQGEVRVDVDSAVAGKVTYTFEDVTLEKAIQQIAKDHNLIYEYEGGTIYVEKGEDVASALPGTGGTSSGRVHTVQVRNSSASAVLAKLPKIFKTGESVILDESSNSLIFYGSESSYRSLTQLVGVLDKMPTQILIEGQIVETSKNFVRDVGFKWGDPAAAIAGGGTVQAFGASTGTIENPNLTAKLLLGQLNSYNLEAQIIAAESSGNAKIISRPKVITLNNQSATITSGVTWHVRTLTTSSTTGTSGDQQAVTGGLQSVSAGLNLQVKPLIVGSNSVRLDITVTNSEPNDSLQVDGIPGIVDNSANTSVIVQNGNTAAIAGLVKNVVSKTENAVPGFSKIPILGWLFRSHGDKDRNSELMIFIRPRIVSGGEQVSFNHGENPN